MVISLEVRLKVVRPNLVLDVIKSNNELMLESAFKDSIRFHLKPRGENQRTLVAVQIGPLADAHWRRDCPELVR